jgi:energy-coupling factor transporter ATP-binding protein EcfA2
LDEIVAFAGVDDAIDTPVKRYSSGMVARLGFAVAAHMDPEVLLVDEVLSVGDVGFQTKCLARMKEIRKSGAAMIFVSHDIPQVMQLCDRLLVLDRGKVAHYGDRDEGARTYFDLATGRANYTGADVHEMGRVRVRLADELGHPADRIEFGQTLVLRVDCDFPTPVGATQVVVRIQSAEGQPLYAFSSGRGNLRLKTGASTFLCRLPHVRLLPGSYKTTAHVQDVSSGRILEHFLHQQPILVTPPADGRPLPAAGTAFVDADEEWRAIA